MLWARDLSHLYLRSSLICNNSMSFTVARPKDLKDPYVSYVLRVKRSAQYNDRLRSEGWSVSCVDFFVPEVSLVCTSSVNDGYRLSTWSRSRICSMCGFMIRTWRFPLSAQVLSPSPLPGGRFSRTHTLDQIKPCATYHTWQCDRYRIWCSRSRSVSCVEVLYLRFSLIPSSSVS